MNAVAFVDALGTIFFVKDYENPFANLEETFKLAHP